MASGEQTTRPPRGRTRFARVYSDGSISIEPAGLDFIDARNRLCAGHDDDDVELLELEITVIRSHGYPKMRAVTEHSARCPTCGETVYVEVPSDAA